MNKSVVDTTYRDIAKMFASAMPVKDEEFGLKVSELHELIKAMPQEEKVALKSAYIFSRKVPRQEREDLFQELAMAVFEAKTKDEKLAYTIARCDWKNWWSKYSIRQHTSLDSVVNDSEGNSVTLAELIVGEVEFENKVCADIECKRIWNALPEKIRPLVLKRLIGKALTHQERNTMNYYVKTQGVALLIAS